MEERIRLEANKRGITRLCHFTPFRNLLHIAKEGHGLLSTAHLEADERAILNPTDLKRLDGQKGHICCSIEYPNAWYFRTAQSREDLFKGWVVLCIAPSYLWTNGTLFSTGNAAAASGRGLQGGFDAFESLFAPTVRGSRNTYVRQAKRPASCPTDEQAEVLVPDQIQSADIQAVAVESESDAKYFAVAMELAQVENWSIPFIVAPAFFNPYSLRDHLRFGVRPEEIKLETSILKKP